jgi:hypothetical protein
MRTISADFNAMTESGHIRLELPCSKKDIEREHLAIGDWTWLGDGEVVVGAQVAHDDRYGTVGVPDWDTLVHLDEEEASGRPCVGDELQALLSRGAPEEDEQRIFQLVTQLEYRMSAGPTPEQQAMFSLRRALGLRKMGKFGLALLEVTQARAASPQDEIIAFVYLDLLRLEDLPSGMREVERLAASPSVPAALLAASINILATRAEQAGLDEFESLAGQILVLCDRLDRAPDVLDAGPSLLALSEFNRGLVLLRKGQITQAGRAFERAHQRYPEGPSLEEMRSLQTYDHHAREVARRVRSTIAGEFPPRPVAA